MGIIFVIVFGTVLATIVLFIHGRKVHMIPLPTSIRKVLLRKVVWVTLVEPPVTLIESWTEYGILSESRIDANSLDPLLLERMRSNKVGFGCRQESTYSLGHCRPDELLLLVFVPSEQHQRLPIREAARIRHPTIRAPSATENEEAPTATGDDPGCCTLSIRW